MYRLCVFTVLSFLLVFFISHQCIFPGEFSLFLASYEDCGFLLVPFWTLLLDKLKFAFESLVHFKLYTLAVQHIFYLKALVHIDTFTSTYSAL